MHYGLIAVRETQVCIVDTYWSYAVHLELPELPTVESSLPGVASTEAHRKVHGLANATQLLLHAMKTSVVGTVRRILDLVPEIDPPKTPTRARTSRGLLDFVGKVQSFLFGTATEADVESMKKLINDVEVMAETATADAARTREGLAAFTKIEDERLQNFRKVLEEEHKTIEVMYTEIRSAADSEQIALSAVAYATQALARYVNLHDDLLQLLSGIEDLVQGHLTPRLVDMGQVTEVFRNITGTLRRMSKDLCLSSAAEIYTSGSYDFARKGKDLYVHVRLPVTDKPRMTVYKVIILPIPVPGEQGLLTTLKDMPKFIVMDDTSGRTGEISERPRNAIIQAGDVKWYTRRERSCLTAIQADNAQAIAQLCDFTVRKAELPPRYIKLSEKKYVVSNLTKAHTACKNSAYKPLSVEECNPCLITLGCSCSLLAGELEIRAEAPSCDNYTSQTDVSHAINMAVLRTFYEATNDSLTGAQLLDPSMMETIQPIKFPFFSEQTDKLLAADETASYSLKKLTESLQNDSVILHTPAEAVIHDYLQRNSLLNSFELTQWTTWLTILPWVVVTLLVTAQVRTYLKMRTLAAAVTALSCARITRVGAFVLKTDPPTTTELPAWLKAVKEIRQEDAGFVVYLTLLTIAFIGLALAVKRALSRRSFIYLDIASSEGVAQIKFTTLPDPTRNFTVATSKKPTTITCTSFGLFAIITFTSKQWKLVYAHDGQRVSLPRRIVLPFWKMLQVKKVLSAPNCVISPLIVHSHEYTYDESVKPALNDPIPPGYEESRL